MMVHNAKEYGAACEQGEFLLNPPHKWAVEFKHEDTWRQLRVIVVVAAGPQDAVEKATESFTARCPNYVDCYMIGNVLDQGEA